MSCLSSVSARLGAATLALTLTVAPMALAEGVDFSGKRIELVTPSSAGGSGDAYVRFFGPWFAKYLAGEPTVIVRNMQGGGGLTGTNWFDASAARDGGVMFLVATSVMMNYLFNDQDPNIQFDPTKWKAFIASPMGRVVYVHPSTGVTTLEDLKGFEGTFVMGTSIPASSDLPSIMALQLLGVDVDVILGLDGGEQDLAYQRGELTANADTAAAYLTAGKDLEEAGEAASLFSFGIQNAEGQIIRDPNFPDMPTWIEAYETVHGKAPEGVELQAFLALHSAVVMASKAIVLPDGTPDEVLAAYVAASAAIVQDPEFAPAAALQIGDYPQSVGEDAQRILINMTVVDPAVKTFVLDWMAANMPVTQ